jgi:hypothetical protein
MLENHVFMANIPILIRYNCTRYNLKKKKELNDMQVSDFLGVVG